MLAIPFAVSATEYSIFVVLQDENLDRIKVYDPAEVNIEKLPAEWRARTLRDVVIGYATKEEVGRLMADPSHTNVLATLKHLSRGFAFKPQAGDSDEPYTKVRT